MRLSKEYEMAVKIAGEVERSFYNSTKVSKKELQEIAKTAALSSNSVSDSFHKGMNETAGVFEKLDKSAKIAFTGIAAGALAATTAAVKVGSSFEAQMSTVQAISGASADELDKLKEKAKQMGATTSFSATEAGQAMEYMAMAGWKTSDMISGIDGIMNLAAASGEELGTTSDIVTDALTAFGMQAKDAAHFSDILAAASSNSNTNVSMMGETFKYAAPLAGALKYSAEDVALAVGLMANAGIKASSAGTTLRSIMSRMAKPTNESGTAMKDLGLSLTDSEGKMKSFADVINDIRAGFGKLTETEKAEYAAMLAGKTGMSGLLAIVNASDQDFDKLSNSIEKCDGAAKRMAETRLDNLNGDVTILKSGLEGLGINFYEQISEPMRDAVQFATSAVGGISDKLPTIKRNMSEFGDAMSDFSEPLIYVGEWLFDHPDAIVSTVAGLGAALTTYKVANKIMKLSSAITSLSPAGAAILGIEGAITAIAGVSTYLSLADKKMKEQNLAKHFGNITLSFEDLNRAASAIVKNKNLDSIQKSIASMENVDKIAQEISDSVDIINQLNWKVDIGIELSDDEKQKYKDSITTYISSVSDIVNEKQYAINVAVSTLMSDDGIEKNNVIDKINEFYAGKQNELSELGTRLNKTVTDAFQDGLLDMDEVKEITELQSQMAKIQSAVASSKFDSQMELLNIKFSGGELDADSFRNLQSEINKQVEAAITDYDESLTLSISNAKVMLDEGAINQSEYEKMVEDLKKGYLEQIGDIELKASNFSLETIKKQYKDELNSVMPEFEEAANTAINTAMEYLNSGMDNMTLNWATLEDSIAGFDGLSDATKDAIKDLFNQMLPTIEQLQALKQKYIEAGIEVPASLKQGLTDASAIGALAENTRSIWTYVSSEISGSPEYANAISKARESGMYVPEVLGQSIESNKSVVDKNIASLHSYIGSKIDMEFRKGYSVNSKVNVITNPTVSSSNPNILPGLPGNPLQGHADGGIFNTPHVAWFAEDGPEAAIPIDGSQNAIDLWLKTGELLGMNSAAGTEDIASLESKVSSTEMNDNTSIEINYNPTFVLSGNVSKEEILDASTESQEKFNRMMDTWLRDNKRLSFS